MLHHGSTVSRGFVLRKFHGRLEAFALSASRLLLHVSPPSSAASIGTIARLTGLAALVAIAVLVLHSIALPEHTALLGLAFGITSAKSGTAPAKSANIRKMEADLKALAIELDAAQVELAAGQVTRERGEEIQAKAHEMEELQGHIDLYNEIAGISDKNRQLKTVTLPGEREDVQRKTITTTAGHLFAMSDAVKNFRGSRQGFSNEVEVKGRLGKHVTLRGEDAVAFEKKAFDSATLSGLGTDAIVAIDHDPEIVRFQEPEKLTIRDVFNVTTTNGDTVRYVRHTATTRAAQSQASRGALKTFLHVTLDAVNAVVETIAVLAKVTEQDVDDAPRLVGLVNGEMTLDVKVKEEFQLLWGTGASGQLLGLFDPTVNVPEFTRAEAGDTVTDIIRRMRTDLIKKEVAPNFVAIDPLDWEEIELSKGTDERYIWGLITDVRGPRIWSLRVIETSAMTNSATDERRILVGDGIRGATIYDRQGLTLAVGFMDDDFGRNLRTLRAEERLAFAVKRPFAFEFSITNEPNS